MAGKTETINEASLEYILREIRHKPLDQFLEAQHKQVLEIALDFGEECGLRCEALLRAYTDKMREIDARYVAQLDKLARDRKDEPEKATAQQFKVLAAAMEAELVAEVRSFGNLIRAAVYGERVQ